MSPRNRKLLLAIPTILAAVAPGSAKAQAYEVTDLGATGVVDQPWSVNSLGQVAGYSDLPDGQGGFHAEGFFHDGVTIHYIGTPPNTSRSDLLGVNDLGEAVGKSGTVHEDGEALLRRADGTVLELGTLGGSRSAASAINDSSQVVGWSKLTGDLQSRPFVWEDGVMTPLPMLGGTQAQANWINDAGQIVGSSTNDTDGLTQHAVIWQGGSVERLPPLQQGLNHLARYIHDDGSIAGGIRTPGPSGGSILRAAIWRDGEVDLVLGTLADGTPEEEFASSVAHAVNADGVVVGMSVNASGASVPFVYRNGVMRQLDDLMPDPWVAAYVGAGSLNDAGQIVVSALLPGEAGSYALLLDPVDPGSAYCFGDAAACPCDNPGGPGEGCASSTGSGARLSASGSESVSAGDLALSASGSTPAQPGLFFQGDDAIGGGDGVRFGDGLRCAGGGVVRLEVVPTDKHGDASTSVPVAGAGGVSPGDTRRYQWWYRDPAPSPCGAGFNLSNGVELTWAP